MSDQLDDVKARLFGMELTLHDLEALAEERLAEAHRVRDAQDALVAAWNQPEPHDEDYVAEVLSRVGDLVQIVMASNDEDVPS